MGGVYMFVGTLTQSTKSAKHSQFSLRAYKLFYQAIYVTLISSQELPLTVMIANRLGNLSYPLATSIVLCVRKVLPSFTYLLEQKVGFEPTRAEPTAYKTVPINHYGTSAYRGVGRHLRTNLYPESAYHRLFMCLKYSKGEDTYFYN